MIMGILGPEGAGKTCLMAYLCLKHVSAGGRLLAFPGFEVKDGKNGKAISEPIQMEDWITLPPELRDVLIAIDEIQNFANSMKHMSWINYLFANFAAQRRHRNLGLLYSVQDWGWLDNRIRWLTHVLATCYDLYWSPWGKEQGLKRGELINVTFYDVKGFYTGRPWTQSAPFRFRAKPIWDCYNSYCDVDIFLGMSEIKIKKPRFTLDITGVGEEEPSPGPTPVPLAQPRSADQEIINSLASTPGINAATLRKLARRLTSGNG